MTIPTYHALNISNVDLIKITTSVSIQWMMCILLVIGQTSISQGQIFHLHKDKDEIPFAEHDDVYEAYYKYEKYKIGTFVSLGASAVAFGMAGMISLEKDQRTIIENILSEIMVGLFIIDGIILYGAALICHTISRYKYRKYQKLIRIYDIPPENDIYLSRVHLGITHNGIGLVYSF